MWSKCGYSKPMTKPRRRKLAAQRKDDLIRVRVTEGQRKMLQAAADSAGADLSTWVRMVALKAIGQQIDAGAS